MTRKNIDLYCINIVLYRKSNKKVVVRKDMAQNKIVTDENLMESAKHGTDSYPFKCYFEKLSQLE